VLDVKIENPTTSEIIFIKLYNKILYAKRIFKEKTHEVSYIKYEILNLHYPLRKALKKKLIEFIFIHLFQIT